MIRLSLVIATFNRSEQLLVTLGSVAEQSHPSSEWECVVVDNNSTDDTRQSIERFIAKHPTLNIRYCFCPEQGLSHARNAGINAAKGDIIAFIDDDERIVADFITAYIELFDNERNAMAAGGKIVAEYPSGRPRWMSRLSEEPIANPMDYGEEVRTFPKGRIPGGGNMAFRREVFELIGVFDSSLGRTGKRLIGGEESDLFERIAAAGMAVYYAPRAVMYHIIQPEKLSDDYFRRLSFNNGISQHTRAILRGSVMSLYLHEAMKWIATLLLCLVHPPVQSRYLLMLRWNTTRGIIASGRRA